MGDAAQATEQSSSAPTLLRGHREDVHCVAFNGSGDTLVSAAEDGVK